MSETVVQITQSDVKQWLDIVVTVGELIANRTKSPTDDKVVAVIKQLSNETWMIDLLTNLINLLENFNKEELKAELQKLVPSET